MFTGFFVGQGVKAMLWAAMGALGLAFAAVGVALMTQPANSARTAARPASTPVAQSSAEPPASPAVSAPVLTLDPTATPTAEVSPSPTPTPVPTQRGVATAQPQSQATPTPEPTLAPPPPTPTSVPVAVGTYCDRKSSGGAPDGRVAGALILNGQPAPVGTNVSLAFNGVVGPSRVTDTAGQYRVDFFIGGSQCANGPGSSIAVVVNGKSYSTGRTMPTSGTLIGYSIAD